MRWTVETPQPVVIETLERTEAFQRLGHSDRSRALEEDVAGQRTDAESMPIHMLWSKVSVKDIAK